MKAVTFAFGLLLVLAHTAGEPVRLLARPFSMFRDGPQPLLGYTLFALLVVLAGLMIAASARARRELEVWVFCLAGFFLVVVAVTPSLGPLHDLCTILLILVLYCYFALLLYADRSGWFFVHLTAPLALVVATGLHSYGLWQKALIVYLVAVVNVHYHMVSRFLPGPARPAKVRPRRDPLDKRRVVYVLASGKTWRRVPGRPRAQG
jgi:hypothetical protein